MRTLLTGSALAALAGTVLFVTSPLPASAQLARPQTAASISGDNTLLTDAQWRRGGWGWRGGYGWHGRADEAFHILRERYARGEITKDQYEAMMRDLSRSPQDPPRS